MGCRTDSSRGRPVRLKTGRVGQVGPTAIARPDDLRRRALALAQRNSAPAATRRAGPIQGGRTCLPRSGA